MASASPSDPIGETYEVQVRWSGEKIYYTEENGKGSLAQAQSWAEEILRANPGSGIEVRLVHAVRNEVWTQTA